MFDYSNGKLHIDNVAVEDIAKKIEPPFYAYSTEALEKNYKAFESALGKFKNTICYSVKANTNLSVIKTLAAMGCGADVVSAGEMYVAMKAGIPANKIVFSGVGKTPAELEEAIKNQILQINAESEAEVEKINEIALKLGTKGNLAIRVNPNVDAKTHEKITTGKKENKFGVDWEYAIELYKKASKMQGLNIVGITMHIGSQLIELEPFREAFEKMAWMVEELEKAGITLENLDLGGGLGITYNDEVPPSKEAYAKIVEETLGKLNKHIITEPGRAMVGDAGILVSKVVYTKKTDNKNFLIIDAAMNDLVRPAMYDAWHTIKPVNKTGAAEIEADIVGPICESSDVFAKDRLIEPLQAGDLIAIFCAGAYGSSMSSIYNFRPLVPEVLVKGAEFAVVRKRTNYEEMLKDQDVPKWL